MTSSLITRQFVQEYFRAQISRDPERILPYLDDEVTWSIGGPIDLLHFCGEQHGKEAVIDACCRLVPSVLTVTGMEYEEILIDGDRAATFMRLSGVHSATGRTVSYRCAQFLRFRDAKLLEFRSIIDSFDAAEQVLGHAIDTSAEAPMGFAGTGDRVAL
jgi:ketosteroid isomerase-like protein